MTTKDLFCAYLAHELETTLNAFRAIPDAGTTYQVHPKARTTQQLVDHITAHLLDLIEAVGKTEVHHNFGLSCANVAETCDLFKISGEKLLNLLSKTDEATWNEKILPIYAGGHKLMDLSLRDMNYNWLFDMIHHRGQLSTYYRAMGTVPPNIYGPNAEQTEAMFANAAA